MMVVEITHEQEIALYTTLEANKGNDYEKYLAPLRESLKEHLYGEKVQT